MNSKIRRIAQSVAASLLAVGVVAAGVATTDGAASASNPVHSHDTGWG